MKNPSEITPITKKLSKDPIPDQKEIPVTTEALAPVPAKAASNPWMIVAIIVFLLLMIAGGVLAYLLLKKPASTTALLPTATLQPVASPSEVVVPGTKTYTNVRRSYSVEYPSDWQIREYTDPADGAIFTPPSQPDDTSHREITVNVMRRLTDRFDLSFQDYVKIAAPSEIQNYEKLATIKTVVTNEGVTGYETTWKVQPLMGQADVAGESLPITYFALPYNTTATLQVFLGTSEDLVIYEKMLKTFKFFGKAPPPTSTPTIDDSQLIREAIFKANNWSASDDVSVTVNSNDGKFANGSAGNGFFYAEKVAGNWEIVASGNGVITCASLTKYPDFPKTLIAECYDEATGNSVKR